MSRPSRAGFTGNPDYRPTTAELARESARSLADDAAMAMAAARDYPVATSALALTVGALGLFAGYILGSAHAHDTRNER